MIPMNPQSILAAMEHAHGGWGDLMEENKMYNTPIITTIPQLDKTDLSTERYIFDNEASYGQIHPTWG